MINLIKLKRIPIYAFVLTVCALCLSGVVVFSCLFYGGTRSFWPNANKIPILERGLFSPTKNHQKNDSELELQWLNETAQSEQIQEASVPVPDKTPLRQDIYPSDFEELASEISDTNTTLGRCCSENPLEERHKCLDLDLESIDFESSPDWQRKLVILRELLRNQMCLMIPMFLEDQCADAPDYILDQDLDLIANVLIPDPLPLIPIKICSQKEDEILSLPSRLL